MKDKYKEIIPVFYYDNIIYLTDQQLDKPNTVFIRSRSDLDRFLDRFFASEQKEDIFLKANNLTELFKNFKSYFKLAPAAGGVVENKKKEFLIIKRFDIWDLPKGKLKKNENVETCALREVGEETGVSRLKIISQLPSTLHIYLREEKYILKETTWFRMFTEFLGELKPQTKEDITEAIWMNRKKAHQALSESYRSIRDILLPGLMI